MTALTPKSLVLERASSSRDADLLMTAGPLTERLRVAIGNQNWLDSYLLAVGLTQLVADRLHPDPLQLRRAAGYLAGLHGPAATVAGRVASAAAAAGRRPAPRSLHRADADLADLTARLAGLVLDPTGGDHPAPVPPQDGSLVAALGGQVIRLPAGFTSFDQHPDDLRWLAAAYLEQYPAAGTPLCVLGVRTSGCYLAPLLAAALQAAGVATPVPTLTYRPRRPFRRTELARLRALARAGGRVLVIDDPPGSGASMAAAAVAVADAGMPHSAVVLLVSLFDGETTLPDTLRRWRAVLQPWQQWSVHRRLGAAAVRRTLTELLGPNWELAGLRPEPLPPTRHPRGHARARFSVRLVERRTGRAERRDLLVEGAGLGYLGRHAMAAADALPGLLPRVYGFADGMLYRDWLPATSQPPEADELADAVAGYVAARHAALPVRNDPTPRLRGRDPVWEIAAALLAHNYGPLAPAAQSIVLAPLTRRLLTVGQPSVVDGSTDSRHWLPDPTAAGRLVKVEFHQRTFSHLELCCYDPVFDLAGAAANPPAAGFEALLRVAYSRITGEPVDAERWLLYRLAQLWRHGWAGDLPAGTIARRSAAAVHDYLAERYLTGLSAPTGPFCALDLDGVLESDPLGFPTTTPLGAITLRALIAHGYRPLLVTGRSLDDAADRCAAFGLAGAVAEYGAVCYTSHDNMVTDLRNLGDRRRIDRLRDTLGTLPHVTIDPQYRHIIRASTHGGPLTGDLLADQPELTDSTVRIIPGQGQTDIAPAGLDKGTGLRALSARLPGPQNLALAVGDSAEDLPMLARAALARAPGNADAAVRAAGIPLTRRGYQAGLAQAAAALLGHRPGCCPTCRPPAFSPRTRALLAVLALRERGLTGLPARTARLAILIGTGPWW